MSKDKMIKVAFANIGIQHVSVEDILKWEPKNINRMRGHVFFSVGGTYVSIKIEDFNEIFGQHK